MQGLDGKILDLIKRYMSKLWPKKVLTSMEEVEANTNETNLVAAPVVAELNNKLAGFEPIIDPATGKITGYKTDVGGADTVFPFNGIEYPDTLTVFSGECNDNGSIVFDGTFLGKAYSYVTVSGSSNLAVYINNIQMPNGKTRFTPNNINTFAIRTAKTTNTRCYRYIVLSKI